MALTDHRQDEWAEYVMESRSPKETAELAAGLGRSAWPGLVICLNGDLGAGKTCFAQGFGIGLGTDEVINSPTFTILQIYEEGRLPLYHFDVYRIEDPMEMDEIGYEEYFFGEGVTLIEWSEQIPELLPEDRLTIEISRDPQKGFDYRKLVITGPKQEVDRLLGRKESYENSGY